MTTAPASHDIHGATLAKLDAPAAVLEWLFGERADPPFGPLVVPMWAVVQCSDTLVWGVNQEGKWRWASDFDNNVRPPSARRLIEARVFSPDREVLIWRNDDGAFAGRIATNAEASDTLLEPIEDRWPFEGAESRLPGEFFVARTQRGGNVVVTPTGKGVSIRQYVESSADTGLLRIVLSRFVEVLP